MTLARSRLSAAPPTRDISGDGDRQLLGAARAKAVYGRDGLITPVRRVWLSSVPSPRRIPASCGPTTRYCCAGSACTGTSWSGFVSPKDRPSAQRFSAPTSLTSGSPRFSAAHASAPPARRAARPSASALDDGPVAPKNVPPQPELTVEAAAILGRIKREAAISVTDAMHLAMLRRWTGVAEAPAVAELIQNDLASVSKVVVFAIHCEVIKFIADAIGPAAAVINGRYVAVSAPGNDRRFPELGSATRADPADQRSRHRIDVARGASRHFC